SGYRFARTMASCGHNNFAARMGDDHRRCFWMTGSASSLERDGSFAYRSLETEAAGFTGGIRMPLSDDLYLGFGAGFEDFNLTSGDHFTAEGVRAEMAISLSKYFGPWELHGIFNGSTARYDATRQIGITGTLPDGTPVIGGTAYIGQRVNQANFRLGAAYRYEPEGSNFYLRPALDFDASYLYSGNASEWNSDYGLDLHATRQWVLSATPSLELGVSMQATSALRMQAFLRGEVSF